MLLKNRYTIKKIMIAFYPFLLSDNNFLIRRSNTRKIFNFTLNDFFSENKYLKNKLLLNLTSEKRKVKRLKE